MNTRPWKVGYRNRHSARQRSQFAWLALGLFLFLPPPLDAKVSTSAHTHTHTHTPVTQTAHTHTHKDVMSSWLKACQIFAHLDGNRCDGRPGGWGNACENAWLNDWEINTHTGGAHQHTHTICFQCSTFNINFSNLFLFPLGAKYICCPCATVCVPSHLCVCVPHSFRFISCFLAGNYSM